MKKVMATGVFDILHPGHIYFLEEAKKLGDVLIVVVARDSTAARLKKLPVLNEKDRLEIISSLKMVDKAILGDKNNMFKTVAKIKPDIIALGYDQAFEEKWIEEQCRKLGLATKVVRIKKYKKGRSSRRIIRRILNMHD
ncbi:MAG: adenylyltransferase/cytidyltransferase family protein [Candidatus Micrarchaeia archaeon]